MDFLEKDRKELPEELWQEVLMEICKEFMEELWKDSLIKKDSPSRRNSQRELQKFLLYELQEEVLLKL